MARAIVALLTVLLLVDLFRADSLLGAVGEEGDPLLLLALLTGLAGVVCASGSEGFKGVLASYLLLFTLSLCGAVALRGSAETLSGFLPVGAYAGPRPRMMFEDILVSWWLEYCLVATVFGFALLHRLQGEALDGAVKVAVLAWGFGANLSLQVAVDALGDPALWYYGLFYNLGVSMVFLAALIVVAAGSFALQASGWPSPKTLCWSLALLCFVFLDYCFALWISFGFVAELLKDASATAVGS